MSLTHEVESIRRVPMLSHLAPAAQKILCFASERFVYNAGDVLFRQGDASDSAFLVLEGTAEVLVWTSKGSLLVNTVGSQEIVGETGMFGDLPDDLRQLEDLTKFPFTTKDDLRRNYPFGMFARCMSLRHGRRRYLHTAAALTRLARASLKRIRGVSNS